MKREIKFRAWGRNNIDKPIEMHYNVAVANGGIAYPSPLKDSLGTNIMQYTGLKDKNGKEIYEGDIVKTNWQHDGVDNYDYEIIGEIKWSDYYVSFRIVNKNFDMPLCHIERESFCDREENNSEVLGNIYQNPELIK